MYILKVKGAGKIPDYIQIRDESFSLMAYFKINAPKSALSRCNLIHKVEEILQIVSGLEYGRIQKLDL